MQFQKFSDSAKREPLSGGQNGPYLAPYLCAYRWTSPVVSKISVKNMRRKPRDRSENDAAIMTLDQQSKPRNRNRKTTVGGRA